MTTEPPTAGENHEMIAGIVSASTLALFEEAGAPVTLQSMHGSQPTRATIAGLVGFTSEKISGSLLVATSFEVCSMTRPLEVRSEHLSAANEADWLKVRDWAAELANQLAGRIKSRLFALDVNLRVTIPTALSGNDLAMATPKSAHTKPIVFAHPAGEVWVRWDAILDPDLMLSPSREGSSMKEGEVLLF